MPWDRVGRKFGMPYKKNPFIASINEQEYLEFIDTDISFVLSKKTWQMAVPIVQRAKTILDIGCGVGTLLYNIEKECRPTTRIVGLTRNEKHCQYAKMFVPNATLICGEALKSPFKDSTIPLIFSTMLIEHVDEQLFIKEIRRILRKNGALILSTVLKKRWAYYFYKNEKGERVLAPDHLNEYTSPEELINLLNKHGLVTKKYHIVPIKFSPIDFLFHSIYRLTKNKLISNLSKKKIVTLLRKITRIPIPGFFTIEVIALKKFNGNRQ